VNQIPKRLIEVDLPIKRISEHARREKSIRHGHISTMHTWWARRPLAACRAVICAALWPDPADPSCPQEFQERSAQIITEFARETVRNNALGMSCTPETFAKWVSLANPENRLDPANESHLNLLRFALLDFVADFSNWDNSTVPAYLDASRALTQAAHEALGGGEGTHPFVVDPFAGGGSIPLEALRVGADAFASDLNPVPVILNKVILEYIPKFGQSLSDAVRKWGYWIRAQLDSELRGYYPMTKDGDRPGAFLWARTILSEAPSQDEYPVEVPLLRSMLLLKKQGRYQALRWVRDDYGKIKTEIVMATYADGTQLKVRRPLIEIFQPSSPKEVEKGTSSGGAATCPITGFTTSVEGVRRQLTMRRGGAGDARLLCVIATSNKKTGRLYVAPTSDDLDAAYAAADELSHRIKEHVGSDSLLPDGELNHLRGFFNVVLYGMTKWGDLFSPRQALGLTTLVRLIKQTAPDEKNVEFKTAIQTCLALALDRCADKCASLVVWDNTRDMATHVFGRQALPMIWDFAEVSLLSDNGWDGATEWVVRVIEAITSADLRSGQATSASATRNPLPDDTVDAVVTDPPYYAAIPYADLSDFFYSWLKRSIGHLYPDLFCDELSPKDEECVSLSHRASMYRHKDSAWFEETMAKACAECRRIAKPAGIGVFVFANKETAGWEAMLGALISSGWIITGSWPVDTEMGNRLRAQNSAALASSVHLVCRPRVDSDGSFRWGEVGDWRDVLGDLPRRIHEWMPRLAAEGVVGADAIFACLGPALEIFSRYDRVEKANGELVTLKEYLEQVWAAVSKEALNMVFAGADASGFEEDARLTAMWLWTMSDSRNGKLAGADDELDPEEDFAGGSGLSKGGYILEFDAARKIAQGLGARLELLPSLVEIKGETARLLPVAERTRKLFGKDEAESPVTGRKKKSPQLQLGFVADLEEAEESGSWGAKSVPALGATVLDRVHQSMILFAAGRGEALRRFFVDEGVGRDGRFWRLAQVLSYLYPPASEEKRWVDGVLARKKGLGFG
jgi:putative DNA methylase